MQQAKENLNTTQLCLQVKLVQMECYLGSTRDAQNRAAMVGIEIDTMIIFSILPRS